MAANQPEVALIRDYGVVYEQSASGGYGIEHYAVYGLTPPEVVTAQSLAPPLPKVGLFHVDPRLSYIGTVQKVTPVQFLGPLGFIARVTYATGGTFNFSTRIGARYNDRLEYITLPVMGRANNSWFSILPEVQQPRAMSTRVESVRYFGSVDAALDLIRRNIGLYYVKRGGVWINDFTRVPVPDDIYALTGANIVTDAGNNTRIDTYFMVRQRLPAFPSGTFAGQDVDIPELPPDGQYTSDARTGLIQIYNPVSLLNMGEPLPWLP